jgi:hypothetical protein
LSNDHEHHRSAWGAGIPNNWYQSLWFKVVFDFLLKNESCQNYVLTIPLCRKGKRTITHINGKGGDCWNIANYVAAIVKEDGCHVRVKESCWCSICSPLTLSKKEATMVGCWWQPTTIVQCQSLVSLAATIVDKGARGAVIEAYK